MEALFAAIETAPPVAALKRSFITYPLVNALHIAAIGMVAATAVLMDLRVLGRLRGMDADAFVGALRPIGLTAFALAALSGLALFSVKAGEYAANPAFRIKLALIATAGANLALFSMRTRGGIEAAGGAAKVMAGVSLLLWLGIIVAGRMIAFV